MAGFPDGTAGKEQGQGKSGLGLHRLISGMMLPWAGRLNGFERRLVAFGSS